MGSITLSAEQTAILTWIANNFTPPLSITLSAEDESTPINSWQNRFVTFSRDIKSYTSNLDVDLTLPNGPTVVMGYLRETIDGNMSPVIERYPMPTPPVPLPPPTDLVTPGVVTFTDGRYYRIDTRGSDGKKRKMEQSFGGLWVPVTDWK